MARKALLMTTALLIPATASAYIDSSAVILEDAAQRRAAMNYETLVVRGRIVMPPEAAAPVVEELWSGRGHRREIQTPDAFTSILTLGRKRWTGGPQGLSEGASIKPDPIVVFLAAGGTDPGGRRGRALLEAHGIDASVVSLSRQQYRPCYVIGAQPSETDRPQLWVDKELLMPVRMVTQEDGQRVERRWLDVDNPLTTPFFPKAYEERRGNVVTLRIEYTQARPNGDIDERRFRAPGG